MHGMPGAAPVPRAPIPRAHVNLPPSRGDDLRAAGVVLAGLGTVAALAFAERLLGQPRAGGILESGGRLARHLVELPAGTRARPGEAIFGRPGASRSSQRVWSLSRFARTGESSRRGQAGGTSAARRASRQLRTSAALLSGAVLTDSAMEHYRGNFENPAMFLPLVSSALSILANVEGLADGGGERMRPARRALHGLAQAIGVAGLGFHIYNITKRPGGLNFLNLFYAAPFGSPAALTLAGAIGDAAEQLDMPASGRRKLFGLPFGRGLAALTSFALAGTVSEVLLLHYRGAFQNPFMWIPVTLPPVSAGLMAKAAAMKAGGRSWLSRGWLWGTALIGIAGVGFHAFGVARAMGGWKNWRQNLIDGPPLPAPPSFSALALAGIAALDLIEAER